VPKRIVLDWCRAGGHNFILGVAATSTLRRHITDREASTKARFDAVPGDGKARRFKAFHDGAKSWSRGGGRDWQVIARVEVSDPGPDTRLPDTRFPHTRFIVTNLKKGSPRWLYEHVYCRRGQAENHDKS